MRFSHAGFRAVPKILSPFVFRKSGLHFGFFLLVVCSGVFFHCIHRLFHLFLEIFFAGTASRFLFLFHNFRF